MRKCGILAAIVLAVPGSALAAEIAVPSRIEAVTVFPSGAQLTRSLKVKLAAGEHTLVVDGITGAADSSSIRIEAGASDKLEIGSVDVKQLNLASTDPQVAQSARKRLEDELEALGDQRAAEDDVVKAAEMQQAYLENLGKLPEARGSAGAQAPKEDWQALVGVIGNGMNEASKAIAGAKRKQRQLDRSMADLRKEIDAAGGQIESRTQVRIFVSAAAPVEADLKLRYQVENASWSAFYDARLATGDQGAGVSPSLAIIRRAAIQQNSGEDWEDVALALSSTRPGHATAARQPETLSIDFAGLPAGGRSGAPASQEMAKSDLGPLRADYAMAPPAPKTSPFQTVYAIPGRIAIKANGEAKRLQLGSDKLEPSLLVLTVPRFDLTAYLYARLTLPKSSNPMLAGPVALFRDGVFTGNGEFPQLAPGEEYELGFGADERVKVKQAVTEDKKGETGTFTTSHMEERHYAISVKNLHTQPIKLHVIDRIPVAKHQDIKVDFTMDKGPQHSARDVNGRRGVMLWAVKTGPDEEAQIGFGYRITSPADKPITYLEQNAFDQTRIFRFGAATRF
jgi:uncharacterized protein (TIGR02231 family)